MLVRGGTSRVKIRFRLFFFSSILWPMISSGYNLLPIAIYVYKILHLAQHSENIAKTELSLNVRIFFFSSSRYIHVFCINAMLRRCFK